MQYRVSKVTLKQRDCRNDKAILNWNFHQEYLKCVECFKMYTQIYTSLSMFPYDVETHLLESIIRAFFTLNYREISILWAIKIVCLYRTQILLKDYKHTPSIPFIWRNEITFKKNPFFLVNQTSHNKIVLIQDQQQRVGDVCNAFTVFWCISSHSEMLFFLNKSFSSFDD